MLDSVFPALKSVRGLAVRELLFLWILGYGAAFRVSAVRLAIQRC